MFNIREILNELKIEIKKQYYEREFHVIYTKDYLILVTGIGSASVEIAANELAMIEIEKVFLAGTCGTSKDFKIGEPVFINEAKFSQGSPLYYTKEKSFKPKIQSSLQPVTCVSSDSFYKGDTCADVVDMDTAYVYAFQEIFNFKAVSIKGISNKIGEHIDNDSVYLALKNSIKECLHSLSSD